MAFLGTYELFINKPAPGQHPLGGSAPSQWPCLAGSRSWYVESARLVGGSLGLGGPSMARHSGVDIETLKRFLTSTPASGRHGSLGDFGRPSAYQDWEGQVDVWCG